MHLAIENLRKYNHEFQNSRLYLIHRFLLKTYLVMLPNKLISPHCERCSVRRYFMGGHSRHPFQCNEKKSNAWQHPPSIMKDLRGQCNVSDKERHENLPVKLIVTPVAA